jgi:hypothetical protein
MCRIRDLLGFSLLVRPIILTGVLLDFPQCFQTNALDCTTIASFQILSSSPFTNHPTIGSYIRNHRCDNLKCNNRRRPSRPSGNTSGLYSVLGSNFVRDAGAILTDAFDILFLSPPPGNCQDRISSRPRQCLSKCFYSSSLIITLIIRGYTVSILKKGQAIPVTGRGGP